MRLILRNFPNDVKNNGPDFPVRRVRQATSARNEIEKRGTGILPVAMFGGIHSHGQDARAPLRTALPDTGSLT
jgi:hypothetical protein